jgi:hypothetical protein
MVAIREAAARRLKRLLKQGSERKRCSHRLYKIDELVHLTGASQTGLRRDLNMLQKAGLLTFEPSCILITETPLSCSDEALRLLPKKRSMLRPIPIPRRFLRFLSRCQSPAVLKTAIAHLLRGLSLDRTTGKIKPRGTVKLSWISTIMGISERAARYARTELIRLGWITRDECSHQWKLNRDGAYFEINLEWRQQRVTHKSEERRVLQETGSDEPLVDNSPPPMLEIAPPPGEICLEIASPNIRLKTPYGIKNQKTQQSEPAGVFSKPTIWNVIREDLNNFYRTEILYHQAVATTLIDDSEASKLNFFGAAIRAKSTKRGDPVRIFLGIIRQELWHHITQDQEDSARRALTRFREKNSLAFQREQQSDQKTKDCFSSDLLSLLGIDLGKMAA